MMYIENVLNDCGFKISHKELEDGKEETHKSYEDLNLCESSEKYLKKKTITLWSHQHECIKYAKEGCNVCVTTSTSSGKTQIFQVSALEILHQTPGSKAIAIYPMKALGSQQVDRWKEIADCAGLSVGIIDGNHTGGEYRKEQLEKDILVITPDSLHAFVLGNLNNRNVGQTIKEFVSKISIVIIDELHLYKGYFGTNAAYMFRRLNNVRRLLRKRNDMPQYITASATMPNATLHSFNITGAKDFVEVGYDQDGSPSRPKTFLYVESKNATQDRNEQIQNLVFKLAEIEGTKTITFVESRQKAGQMAAREKELKKEGIYPYRSGYEESVRDEISKVLEDGRLFKGVVSTSALEIGIDIDGLNICIIADMPYDKNSYQQRIGRVGRYGCDGNSYVIIVRDSNSFASNMLFGEYGYDMDKALPDYEPALYLEDESIQNIHALCHVGDTDECEYEDWKGTVNQKRTFDDGGCFPDSFVKLCNDILTGNAPDDYSPLEEKSSHPHFENSLRFFGAQYQLYNLDDNNQEVDRPISRRQLATEAYKGAIRNTVISGQSVKHRIKYWVVNDKTVVVRNERDQHLKTSAYSRTFLIPNFNQTYLSYSCGDTGISSMKVFEHIQIWGYYEIRGNHREYNKYDKVLSVPKLPTTGVLFFHPAFNNKGVKTGDIAQILFEALLRRNAFDRNDLNYIGGKLFTGNSEYLADTKFVALYDASPLNLSQRIAEKDKLKDLFGYLGDENHIDIIARSVCPGLNQETKDALKTFCDEFKNNDIVEDERNDVQEKFFKQGTLVYYHQPNADNPADETTTEMRAMFVGRGNDDNLINLWINDKGHLFNVDLNDISPIEGVTEYVNI